ncbi:MAG: ATP-binding protein [Oceanipulchritudo sp.]
MELQTHPFFKQMDKESVEALTRSALIQNLPRGTVIFEEGDISDSIYLVLEGTIEFSKKVNNRGHINISQSHKGEYFGEIGVLTNDRRSLRAEAKTECSIACIPGAALVNYLRKMPGPVQGLMQSIIAHLQGTTRKMVDDRIHQEKMALIGNMTNTIVHDFKNPFCLISLSSQLLRQKHPEPESQKLCQNIEKQVDRMVSMVTELAEFSRGEHTINKVKLKLKDLFDEFKSLNHPYFESTNVQISIEVPDVQIIGAKAKLFRVFQNLIGNAIEAFGDRAGAVKLTGTVSHAENRVQLFIEDNAGGIPESIRDRLFEPFVSYGKREGTGLGTAIARSIIEAHGGTITYRTETGRGTIFTINLPLAK